MTLSNLCRLPQVDASQPLVLLGIDCEMCVSEDSEKELIQVAVVDQQGNTLIKVGAHEKNVTLDLVGLKYTQAETEFTSV